MVVATKPVVAIAAAFFLVVSFGDAAHSQNALPLKILKISESEASLERGPRSCGTDEKFEPATRRDAFARPPYPERRSTDSRNDPCGEIRREVSGSRDEEERIQKELLALGRQGEIISRARDQVLKILETENSCTAWFREADPDPAGTFRSVNFALEEDGPSYVFGKKEIGQVEIFKHPHVASSLENAGRNATIRLNVNGAFFKRATAVLEQDRKNGPLWPAGLHALRVASYSGNSVRAQVTTLLHELGHIVGRLPSDDDSWNGQSTRNTDEVLRHCSAEIRSVTRKPTQRSGSHGQETALAF